MGIPLCDIKVVQEVDGIVRFLDFANPLLVVDPQEPFMQEHYAPADLEAMILQGQRLLLVIEQGGQVIAGAMAKIYDAQDLADRQITPASGEVFVGFEYAAVAAPWRRRGFLTLIWARACAWAKGRGATTMVVEIELENAVSLAVFKKFGFLMTHQLPAGLGIPGPFYILTKDL